MAHVGQKLAFGPSCPFGFLAGVHHLGDIRESQHITYTLAMGHEHAGLPPVPLKA